jgi:hypothetical protein
VFEGAIGVWHFVDMHWLGIVFWGWANENIVFSSLVYTHKFRIVS